MNYRSSLYKWAARIFMVALLVAAAPAVCTLHVSADNPPLAATSQPAEDDPKPIKKVLFLGDSMTGWMAERFNAYADKNDFEVATIVWDGSTISKWANSRNLKKIVEEQNPDAIIVSLGMNELFERNPEKQIKPSIEKLKEVIGDTPFLWIGPPSWPGHSEGEKLNSWLANELGERTFFRSFDLSIPRQSKSNPHPNRDGIEEWIDRVAEWIPENSNLHFDSLDAPASGKFSRSKTFIYKRMKENL